MVDKVAFFGMSLFDLRRRISKKANCKSMDAVAAANRLRRMVETMPGRTDQKLDKIYKDTGLTQFVSTDELIDGLIDAWWGEIKTAIGPYNRADHETHPRSIPIRRTIKKADEYYARYEMSSRKDFDDVVNRYRKENGYPDIKIKNAKYPYITLTAKTPFEITLANKSVNAYATASNVLEVI